MPLLPRKGYYYVLGIWTNPQNVWYIQGNQFVSTWWLRGFCSQLAVQGREARQTGMSWATSGKHGFDLNKGDSNGKFSMEFTGNLRREEAFTGKEQCLREDHVLLLELRISAIKVRLNFKVYFCICFIIKWYLFIRATLENHTKLERHEKAIPRVNNRWSKKTNWNCQFVVLKYFEVFNISSRLCWT